MERIGGETTVLYGDLRERLEIASAMRSIANLSGEFVTKTLKGGTYHYFQAALPTGRTHIYLGPDSDQIRHLIATRDSGKEHAAADLKMFQRLAAQIIAGGVPQIAPAMAKIIGRLEDCGMFQLGGVLVGTIAYQILASHLGVTWEASSRMTQDVDVAADYRLSVAVSELSADIPAAIDSLEMGFFPVPRLSHSAPSTSYAIRGKTLRIDLLTPSRQGMTAPIFIRRLNAAAAPLKYLDYLIEDPVTAVMIAATPCLVKVPQPARYALHKLIISQERDRSAADKKKKDLVQAANMIALLKEDHPGDLELAREAVVARGAGWKQKMDSAAKEGMIEI